MMSPLLLGEQANITPGWKVSLPQGDPFAAQWTGAMAHSSFKIPLDFANQENPTYNISCGTPGGKFLAECCHIIWDEATLGNPEP